MANVNKVFLIGRLTQDPELRYTPGGAAVSDLRLAVNRSFTTRDGDRREETLFIDVTVWNRTAENCCQYLSRGSQVHVEGYLKMDTWDDRNTGEKRSRVKVEAVHVQFLGGRRDDSGGPMPSYDDSQYAPSPSPSGPRRAAPAEPRGAMGGPSRAASPAPAPRHAPAPPPEMDPEDDDIPF